MQVFAIDEFERVYGRPTDRRELESRANEVGCDAERQVLLRLNAPDYWDWPKEGWTCPECGETFRSVDDLTGNYPRCACVRAAYEEAYNAYARQHWDRVAEEMWRETLKPKRYANADLATFQPRPGTEEALRVIRQYIDGFQLGKTSTGLWLVGGVGSGKTHLAFAVARELIRKALVRVAFWQVGKLLYEHKRTWTNRELEDPIPKAATAELLILDDLGQVIPSSTEADLIFMLLNERYGNELPTIVTSNLSDTQLAEVLGPAPVSRLWQMCKAVRIDATDLRLEKALAAR